MARTIGGTVLADTDSTAVAGATCRLLADNQTLAAADTDSAGIFTLNTDIKSYLTLEIGMTGYNTTEIIIESGAKNISLGAIYLSESTALKELTVTGSSITESRGRTIVFPSSADIKASSSAISLFQKLPFAGLEANPINRSLSVGGGTPVILINGIPSTMDDVNAIAPKDIEKIEFSRIVPARYADQGNSGFINITLKKHNDGGTVYLWGRSAVATAFMDGNFRASYHQGPSQFTLAYNPSWRNYSEVYDNSIESYIGHDFRVDLEQHDRNPFYYHYHQTTLKYDYSPAAGTLFTATFRATPNYDKSRTIGSVSDSKIGDYEFVNHSSGADFSPSLDLFLRKDINSCNSIEAQIVGTLSSNDYRRDNEYMYADGTLDSYAMDVDSRRRSLISEISYTHTFTGGSTISGGFQNTVSRSTNTYLTSDYKPVLTENNNYLYASYGRQIGKVYVSLATGLKMFWIKNDVNKRDFIRNRSLAKVSWKINPAWDLTAAFSYGPSIPSLSQLTDYPQQVTPYLFYNGNPELKVAENFLWQIMPGYRYKKFSTSLLLTYRNVVNDVISDMIYLGDGKFLSQSVNADHSRSFNANWNLRLNDIYGFGANISLGISHYYCTGAAWNNKLTCFNAFFTLWWNKGPFTISYWRKIPGKYLSGHKVSKDENGDALSFEYKPDKHWTLGASWMYMFDRKGTRYPSWGYSAVNPSYNERYIKHNGNMVVLSVSYSADFGSIFRSGRRSLNNSDNGSSLLKM